jgi:hypothetical protein
MDPKPSQLRSSEQQVQSVQSQSGQQQHGREFSSVEELLRHDAAQSLPPATLETRVASSIAREPPPRRRWWQRLFQSPP